MAMDGALVGGRCFVSQDAAADAYFGAVAPSLVPGGTSYLSEFVKVSGAWKVRRYQATGGGDFALVAESPVPSASFATCDPLESFKDGQMMGWAVVAAMAAAWCIVVLRRGL
ncbi:hypothetical protein [Cupriavidus taiwanensis]|uniref:hypothetical protein n=1 Tax=Cupriavidus taiwanensis TaxID=164546 RepID=UPI0039C15B65